jgi:hypothetical protein
MGSRKGPNSQSAHVVLLQDVLAAGANSRNRYTILGQHSL